MISRRLYQRVAGWHSLNGREGGQELILAEVVGCLSSCLTVFVPFYSSGTLVAELREQGIAVICREEQDWLDEPWPKAHAIYFGTPTIVNDAPLFESEHPWTKETERSFVRRLVAHAEATRCLRIVSGLGSGDITPEERLEDMGGGRIAAYKDFGEFQDWVMVRNLKGAK